jgi:hypothetical protein
MIGCRKDLLALAFLVLLVTAFFAREVFTDETLVTFRLTNVFPWFSEATREALESPSVTSDCAFSYYPRRVFATEMMRQGQIPFWNPHQFCGTPFLATFQPAVLYPVNLALYSFQPTTQMDLFLYIHFLVAAVFTYLLARKLGISTGGGIVSALTFAFCGFMVTRYGQPTFVSTASWLPAVLYLAEHLIQRPGFRRIGLLGLGLSLCILAGFPQLVVVTVYALMVYTLVRVALIRGKSIRWRAMVVVFVILSICVACLVCALQLLPTYELSTFSYRKTLDYEMVSSSAHQPLVSLKYFIPDILGHPRGIGVLSKQLGQGGQTLFQPNYVSTTGYVGILPLALMVLALTMARRRMVPFLVLGALALLAVFGSGLLYLLYRFLPGFNFSRVDRVVVVYMCSAAVLGGYGFDMLRGGGRRSMWVGLGVAASAVCLAVWLWVGGLTAIHNLVGGEVARGAYYSYASRKVLVFAVLGIASGSLILAGRWKTVSGKALLGAALVLLLVDLVPNALGFKVSQPAGTVLPQSSLVENLEEDTGTWRFAKYGAEVIPSNTATILGFDEIHGYDALNVNHYIEVLGALDSTMIAVSNAALRRRIGAVSYPEALESGVLDMLNVKYVLTVADVGARRPQAVFLLNADFLPRAYLVGRARFFDSYHDRHAYMKSDHFDPAAEVLLQGERRDPGGESATGQPGALTIIKHSPHHVVIEAEADVPCHLVMSDAYYPDWEVTVDGREADLLRANYAFRGVGLDPGPHRIEMRYTPFYFRMGLIFSVAGMGLLAALIASGRRYGPLGE